MNKTGTIPDRPDSATGYGPQVDAVVNTLNAEIGRLTSLCMAAERERDKLRAEVASLTDHVQALKRGESQEIADLRADNERLR
jgi:predicted RNase H-like nuclease (RuvC/YqgF family)